MKNRKDLVKTITARDIEIYELEEKIKELNKYKILYFMKTKEVSRIKEVIQRNLELLPDQVKYNFKNNWWRVIFKVYIEQTLIDKCLISQSTFYSNMF